MSFCFLTLFGREKTVFVWISLRCPQQPGLRQLNLGLPLGWQGPSQLPELYHLLLPSVCSSLKPDMEPGLQTKAFLHGMWASKQSQPRTKRPPHFWLLNIGPETFLWSTPHLTAWMVCSLVVGIWCPCSGDWDALMHPSAPGQDSTAGETQKACGSVLHHPCSV